MKGNTDCHMPNKAYRDHYDNAMSSPVKSGEGKCASCGKTLSNGEDSLCINCILDQPIDTPWGETT